MHSLNHCLTRRYYVAEVKKKNFTPFSNHQVFPLKVRRYLRNLQKINVWIRVVGFDQGIMQNNTCFRNFNYFINIRYHWPTKYCNPRNFLTFIICLLEIFRSSRPSNIESPITKHDPFGQVCALILWFDFLLRLDLLLLFWEFIFIWFIWDGRKMVASCFYDLS